MALRAISLFAGVGALDLGVRLAIPGLRTVCYVEREAYAAAVLVARIQDGHLDEAPIYDDVCEFVGTSWRGQVDIIFGGIPCQPYSLAGERKGDEDDRALWPEFARVVAECRPSLVFIENVPAFVSGGGFRPLGEELCRLGYEIEDPIFLHASDVGAPHIRERVFILAHSERAERWPIVRRELDWEGAGGRKTTGGTPHASGAVADSEREGLEGRSGLGYDDGEKRQTTERGGEPVGRSGRPRPPLSETTDGPNEKRRQAQAGDEQRVLGQDDRGRKDPRESEGHNPMADAESIGMEGSGSGEVREQKRTPAQRRRSIDSGGCLADSEDDHRGSGEPESEAGTREEGERWRRPTVSGGGLADADSAGQRVARVSAVHDGERAPQRDDADGQDEGVRGAREVGRESIPDSECYAVWERTERGSDRSCETVSWYTESFPMGIYPPGPKDIDEWRSVIERCPYLAPAVESGFRLLAPRLAMVLDEDRAHQLRCTGNGVVPSQAGWALMTLLEWAGLR